MRWLIAWECLQKLEDIRESGNSWPESWRKDCGKREEIGNFSTIDLYQTETTPEDIMDLYKTENFQKLLTCIRRKQYQKVMNV
jgi:hypothetical protein